MFPWKGIGGLGWTGAVAGLSPPAGAWPGVLVTSHLRGQSHPGQVSLAGELWGQGEPSMPLTPPRFHLLSKARVPE